MRPHHPRDLVFVGGNGYVVGISTRTGQPVWETQLRTGWFRAGNRFVSLQEDGPLLYAFSGGTLFVLRKRDGRLLKTGVTIPKLKHHAGVFSVDPDSSRADSIAIAADDGDGNGDGCDGADGGDGGD
jgi:hypothetical protein